MGIGRLLLIAMLIFSLLAAGYVYAPKTIRYEIEDWFGRLTAPDFVVPIDSFKAGNQADVINEFKRRGYKLKCYGNLRPEEKVGIDNDYSCWALIKTAFDDVPAKTVAFYFFKERLQNVRLQFPESSFPGVQDYLSRRMEGRPRVDELSGMNFGRDIYGQPLMVWAGSNGFVITSKNATPNREVTVLWSSTEAYFRSSMEKFLYLLKQKSKQDSY